jgi:co-chaperonin GroES (HSP10)
MKNESGLKPKGRAVLVKHYEPPKTGMIELLDVTKERGLMVEQRAVVIEVGPACWPDEEPRAYAGDKVLISKMAGYLAKGPKDGVMYALVNDRDIFCGIDGEFGND